MNVAGILNIIFNGTANAADSFTGPIGGQYTMDQPSINALTSDGLKVTNLTFGGGTDGGNPYNAQFLANLHMDGGTKSNAQDIADLEAANPSYVSPFTGGGFTDVGSSVEMDVVLMDAAGNMTKLVKRGGTSVVADRFGTGDATLLSLVMSCTQDQYHRLFFLAMLGVLVTDINAVAAAFVSAGWQQIIQE